MTSPFPQRLGLLEMMTYFNREEARFRLYLYALSWLRIWTRNQHATHNLPTIQRFKTLQYKISTSTVWYKKVRTNQEAKTTKFEEGPDWWPTLKKIFLQSLNLLAIFLLNTLVPCQYWKMSITLSLNRAFTTLRVLNYFLPKTLPETNREFTPENKA